jgi:hypothetical protein
MSDKTTFRAAHSLGGFVLEPLITREESQQYLDAEVSENAWTRIVIAFGRYSETLQTLKTSRLSKSKDPDKASWHERQKSTAKALEAALDRLTAARKHGDFLIEASENYLFTTYGHNMIPMDDAEKLICDAFDKILHALVMIERAEPQIVEVPTEASARAKLVREIYIAITSDGIEAKASNGFALDSLTRAPTLSDLSPFEQFLDALGIGEEMTEQSFSAFVRSALAGLKRG